MQVQQAQGVPDGGPLNGHLRTGEQVSGHPAVMRQEDGRQGLAPRGKNINHVASAEKHRPAPGRTGKESSAQAHSRFGAQGRGEDGPSQQQVTGPPTVAGAFSWPHPPDGAPPTGARPHPDAR
ncbi:hypothetical protein GCM10010844_31050 [Deinococcus radiotolerans]|uniref:Uncharacterized protein n=1 Tax=Deinococcus radiotolerans TaxID=1309407 RepID=A0ABQ2FLK5_9DEIO|nr:hypothetical protein GCM10010844_31050 [Deinococcus radiotolerans]